MLMARAHSGTRVSGASGAPPSAARGVPLREAAEPHGDFASPSVALPPPPLHHRVSVPTETRSHHPPVLLRRLVHAIAKYYDEVPSPRISELGIRASEQLSEDRFLTSFEEALMVVGALVIPVTAPGRHALTTEQGETLRAFFAREEHRESTHRRWVEPERDRMLITFGTLMDVLRRNKQAALATRLKVLLDSVQASIEQTSGWGRAAFAMFDVNVLFTLPGGDVTQKFPLRYHAAGFDARGRTVGDAPPHPPRADLRRPAQDLHIDVTARRVAETYQLALRNGRFLVPPTSVLMPLDCDLPRSLHFLPYSVLPGDPAEAQRNRCSGPTFSDIFGTARDAVTSTVELNAGDALLFTGTHAGGAQEAASSGRLALFLRLRSSALAQPPDVSELYRCHTADVGVEIDAPHRLAPAFGLPVHAPVQVPHFDAAGKLLWRHDRGNGDAVVWRPVRTT